jgi:hypothetical protein
MATSNRNSIIFWISTSLFTAFMLMSTIPNILSTEEWLEIFRQLGYPAYMLPFLGVAKLLGLVAIVVPGFPRLKEWAYAGLFFDLAGAVYSGLAVGGFDPLMLVMIIPFGLGTVSYIYYHKRLKVAEEKI